MPLIDRLTAEALEGLCDDCPVAEHMKDHLSGVCKLHFGDIPADMNNEVIKLGIQVSAATKLIGMLMVKEEVGCEGKWQCEDTTCQTVHCGTQVPFDLVVQFAPNLDYL